MAWKIVEVIQLGPSETLNKRTKIHVEIILKLVFSLPWIWVIQIQPPLPGYKFYKMIFDLICIIDKLPTMATK